MQLLPAPSLLWITSLFLTVRLQVTQAADPPVLDLEALVNGTTQQAGDAITYQNTNETTEIRVNPEVLVEIASTAAALLSNNSTTADQNNVNAFPTVVDEFDFDSRETRQSVLNVDEEYHSSEEYDLDEDDGSSEEDEEEPVYDDYALDDEESEPITEITDVPEAETLISTEENEIIDDGNYYQQQQPASSHVVSDPHPVLGQSCTYTFVLPKQPAPEPVEKECDSSNSYQWEKDVNLDRIYQKMNEVKINVEEIRDEINRKTSNYPSSYELTSLQENVILLQQEARNSNDRISQLYAQLMHEIVNKRDNQLEFTKLHNKILEQSVQFYELQEKHDHLRRDYEDLTAVTNLQSKDIAELKEAIGNIKNMCQAACDTRRTSDSYDSPPKREVPTVVVNSGSVVQRPHAPLQSHPNGKTSTTTKPASRDDSSSKPGSGSKIFRDCTEAQSKGHSRTGVYTLKIKGYRRPVKVWCDLEQDPGGWTVIQRRTVGRQSFEKSMSSYRTGFGKRKTDYWIGLEALHKLTNQGSYKLHIDLQDWQGNKRFAQYRSFRIGDAEDNYRLKIAHYSGNAGDGLTRSNNMQFSTVDSDNDIHEINCAEKERGGWWYAACGESNLNGVYYSGGYYRSEYQDGVFWSPFLNLGNSYSLMRVVMKIRPVEG